MSERNVGRIYVAFDGSADPDDAAMFVGVVDEEGIVHQAWPEPEPLNRDDVLAAIDRALHAAGTRTCATCHNRLLPNGHSEDFCSDRCQITWHSRLADPPEAVHGPAYAQLHADTAAVRRGGPRLPEPPAPPAPLLLPPCDDHLGAAYRRECPRCAVDVVPLVYVTDHEHTRSGLFGPVRTAWVSTTHACPQCGHEIPGPCYTPKVETLGSRLLLHLTDGHARVGDFITVHQLQRAADPGALLRRMWQQLEYQLTRFRWAWHGNRNRGGS